jgi:hypothetical protein
MQRLEVSCAVRPIYGSLGTKGLMVAEVINKVSPRLVSKQSVDFNIQKVPPMIPILNFISILPSRPTSSTSILIFPFHLGLGLQNDLSPSGFPTKNLHAFDTSLIYQSTTLCIIEFPEDMLGFPVQQRTALSYIYIYAPQIPISTVHLQH